jgi:hypothetical protein
MSDEFDTMYGAIPPLTTASIGSLLTGVGAASTMQNQINNPNTITVGPMSGTLSYGAIGPITASTISPYTFAPTGITGGTVMQVPLEVNGTIKAKDLELNGVSVKDILLTIQDRLAILVPDPAKMEKYAALKAAYEHYKLLEALCREDDKTNDI